MKSWSYLLGVCLFPLAVHAASVDITLNLNAKDVDMVQRFATKEGKSTDQVLRYMCNVGMAGFRDEYRKLTVEGLDQAIGQLTPENRTIVCDTLGTTGFQCPPGGP